LLQVNKSLICERDRLTFEIEEGDIVGGEIAVSLSLSCRTLTRPRKKLAERERVCTPALAHAHAYPARARERERVCTQLGEGIHTAHSFKAPSCMFILLF